MDGMDGENGSVIGYIIDFQQIARIFSKILVLCWLWRFRRRIEEGSKKGSRREGYGGHK